MSDGCSWVDPTEPYQPPPQWTPDHVLHRLVNAFDVLDRLKVRAGPAGFGSSMPTHIREYEDLMSAYTNQPGESDEARDARISLDNADALRTRKSIPSDREISMMEEAIRWPIRFLGAHAGRSHVVRWARLRASGRDDERRSMAVVDLEARAIAIGLIRERVRVR